MTMWQSKLVGLAGVLTAATIGGGFVLVKADPRQPPPARAAAPEAGPKDAPPAGVKKDADRPASLAGRVWAVMDVVREHHLDPPARTDMTLAAAKALLKASGADAPDDLARRAAAVTTEAQLAVLFRDLWPAGAGPGDRGIKLEAAALGGFLDSIPGRPFVFPEPQVRVNEQIRGNRYVGIGIQITRNEKEQFPQIVLPFRRGAARAAGAKPGDLMVEIDGKSTKGVLDMEKVVGWLRGEEGTTVTVVVRQPGSADTRTLKMVRAVIPFESVLGYRRAADDGWDYRLDRDAGVAYVWVQSVKASTLHELRQVERRLRADGAKAVVLDLRFSEGDGHLHDVTLLADGLLDGGLMWSVRNMDGTATEYRADREAVFRGWPVVALVNGTKDSCQALLLAALRDNGRAVLVGEPTANDGLVRSLFPLPGGTNAVTVVTGRLERAVRDKGWPVRPDHAVTLDKDQGAAVRKWLTDKMLPDLPAGTDDRPPTDPQLDRALTLLRQVLKGEGKP
jgi:C-terminal peptidase prc